MANGALLELTKGLKVLPRRPFALLDDTEAT
jgi:hypothetical protein